MSIPLALVIIAVVVMMGYILARGLQPRPSKYISAIPEPVRELRHFYLQVHGITHRNADGSSRREIIRICQVGEELMLVPEPTNRYDQNAIMVCRKNGDQLGYLPAEQALRFTHDMAIGWTYRVTVDEIWHDGRTIGCKLRIGVITMSSRKVKAPQPGK